MIDFDKLFDDFVFREHRPKAVGKYYPSEVGTCIRKLYYSYKFPKQIKPDLLKIFEVGDILHDFVVRVLRSEKNKDVELLKWEVPVKIDFEGFQVSGRVDDLLMIKHSGKNVLVEVKSCSFLSYVKAPQRHHVMQLQLYMHGTGVHNGILLYIEKNDLKTKVFTIDFDEIIVKEAIDRFRELHESLITNSIPVAEAKHNGDIKWMCKGCKYKDRCDSEGKLIS
jgi:CRISPR/Cas system-associated exonuclease Cas4 (RecB family)